MKRKTVKWLGRSLYCCLLVFIAALIYVEVKNELLWGIALLCGMFVICMGLLWISEKDDEWAKENSNAAINNYRAVKKQG